MGSIPGSGRSPGEGNGSPLQYSRLENPMDRGAVGYSPWGPKESDMTEATQQHSCGVQSVSPEALPHLPPALQLSLHPGPGSASTATGSRWFLQPWIHTGFLTRCLRLRAGALSCPKALLFLYLPQKKGYLERLWSHMMEPLLRASFTDGSLTSTHLFSLFVFWGNFWPLSFLMLSE